MREEIFVPGYRFLFGSTVTPSLSSILIMLYTSFSLLLLRHFLSISFSSNNQTSPLLSSSSSSSSSLTRMSDSSGRRKGKWPINNNIPARSPSSFEAEEEEDRTISLKDSDGGESDEHDHETHIWTERERRKKMRTMFGTLHALLPHLPSKADKSTIVDEAVKSIKTLEQTLQNLQKQKLERLQSMCHPYGSNVSREAFMADHPAIASSSSPNMNASVAAHNYAVEFQTWVSPNVVLNVCGDEAQFSVCCPKKPFLLTSICFVLEKYKIEVLSAHISSHNYRSSYMIHTRAKRDHSDLFPEIPVEEIFKQAASEIIQWL